MLVMGIVPLAEVVFFFFISIYVSFLLFIFFSSEGSPLGWLPILSVQT